MSVNKFAITAVIVLSIAIGTVAVVTAESERGFATDLRTSSPVPDGQPSETLTDDGRHPTTSADGSPVQANREATADNETGRTDESTGIQPRHLERAIGTEINRYRDDPLVHDDLDGTLGINSTTGRTLSELAGAHSTSMAEAGYASLRVDGERPNHRYEKAGLYDQCHLESPNGSYLLPHNSLQIVTSVAPNGADETRIAATVVDHWLDDRGSRSTLSLPGAEHLGVGVATATDDVVYVAVALC